MTSYETSKSRKHLSCIYTITKKLEIHSWHDIHLSSPDLGRLWPDYLRPRHSVQCSPLQTLAALGSNIILLLCFDVMGHFVLSSFITEKAQFIRAAVNATWSKNLLLSINLQFRVKFAPSFYANEREWCNQDSLSSVWGYELEVLWSAVQYIWTLFVGLYKVSNLHLVLTTLEKHLNGIRKTLESFAK